jgi:DNA-binding LacI/PurR family transcriptional regulator
MLAREAGFRAALKEQGIRPIEELIVGDLPNRQSAKTIVESLMALPKGRRPTAFFAPHTQLSDGMLAGIHKAGLRIPADVSVVGCSASVTPDITSVWLPIEEIGRVGTEYLLQKLRIADAARDGTVLRVELPVALVEWGSTRAIA